MSHKFLDKSTDDFYLKKRSFDKIPLRSHFISFDQNVVSSPLYLYLINRTPDIISRSVKQRQRQTGSPLPHSRRTNSTCTNQSRRLLFPSSLFSFPFSPPRAAENGSRAINLEARVTTPLHPLRARVSAESSARNPDKSLFASLRDV